MSPPHPRPAGFRQSNGVKGLDDGCWSAPGYVVLANAVPAENIERVRADTWDFLGELYGMQEHDEESWYRTHGKPGNTHTGMVQMYQSQGQWDNRQHPAVHRAFADIHGTEELWVSFDMTNLKPP